MQKSNPLKPFITLMFIYFIVGFLTIVNGQLQAPLQTAFLSEAGQSKNTLVTLISFFFFLGFLICSPFAGKWINKYGYKKTLIIALFFMTGGLFMFYVSCIFEIRVSSFVAFSDIKIPYGYFIFLVGSFLLGTSAAITQVVVNPYAAAYQIGNTQPVQRMNIACAINAFGTTIAPFFVAIFIFAGRAIGDVEINQVLMPFLVLTLVIAFITVWTMRLNIPDIESTISSSSEDDKTSIWSFRHFKFGLLAIFCYVGAEVSIGSNINLYAHQLGEEVTLFGINLPMAALLATIYWGLIMTGRIISSTLSKISPRVQLSFVSVMAMVFLALAMLLNNIWLIAFVGIFHSVMWGCIFTLSIDGLKGHTAKASGIYMSCVFGGAVFPVIQGVSADIIGSWRYTWTIALLCELVILLYALMWSHQKKEKLS